MYIVRTVVDTCTAPQSQYSAIHRSESHCKSITSTLYSLLAPGCIFSALSMAVPHSSSTSSSPNVEARGRGAAPVVRIAELENRKGDGRPA